jgi:hypothetical protein
MASILRQAALRWPAMSSAPTPSLEAARQAAQLAFAASGADIECGSVGALPWPLELLAGPGAGSLPVLQRIDDGLTAVVYRLRGQSHDWTLKRARAQALVHNVDGQTSFLNEVQRRRDIEALKRRPDGGPRWSGLVDTRYAAYRAGVILSPWIEGEPVRTWDERRLQQLFDTVCSLWTEGLFEWDLSPGNLLDDGHQLKLFDFGYMYCFDPLRHFNSAGRGNDQPLFHPAERFETRNFFGMLLDIEDRLGMDEALAAFRLEKQIALQAYDRMRAEAAARAASAAVLEWLALILQRWRQGLTAGAGEGLYRVEAWRSHVLDLADDLHGRSCTAGTLRRADWLLKCIEQDFSHLRRCGGLFWGDESLGRGELRAKYQWQRKQALGFQRPAG